MEAKDLELISTIWHERDYSDSLETLKRIFAAGKAEAAGEIFEAIESHSAGYSADKVGMVIFRGFWQALKNKYLKP